MSSVRTSPSPTRAPDLTTAVEVNKAEVVFRKRGAEPFHAVHELSFSIPKGTIFCLLGPNGSGKTTTINLLTGLLRPTSGSVSVCGLDPTRQRRELLRRIALVPQETALYAELTGRENLEFHARYYGVQPGSVAKQVDHALALVGLTDRAKHRAGTYSGGMQRRLALARAMLTEPEVLFLDEPTLGVDVQSRQAIWDRVQQLADDGCTILLTTNYMEEADRLGREVFIIDRGAAVTSGTPAELKASVTADQVEIVFADPRTTDRAYGLLTDGLQLAGHRVAVERDAASTLLVRVPAAADRLDFLRQLLERISNAGKVTSFRFSEPSLQDVFLHFTGRALRN